MKHLTGTTVDLLFLFLHRNPEFIERGIFLIMNNQIFIIIFSIVLLPVNIGCAFWLFREALNLTGMTFREFLETTSSARISPSVGRHHFRKRQRFLINFFKEHSVDPQKSIRLLWAFGICTLPSLAALTLAEYAAIRIDKLESVLIGDLILIVINVALVVWRGIYRRNHPIDEITAETLNAKRIYEKEDGRKNLPKNIIVYALVGVFFLGILLFFMTGISRISPSQQYQPSQQSAISIHADLITLLNEMGYETANIPTTYWEIDEHKLLHVAAGVKGNSKFEFYGYSDDETVDLVYNQIVYLIVPELTNAEREHHETILPGGNKVFTISIDGINYLVMYQNDTLIYAYSPDSLNEINDILTGIGYLNQ